MEGRPDIIVEMPETGINNGKPVEATPATNTDKKEESSGSAGANEKNTTSADGKDAAGKEGETGAPKETAEGEKETAGQNGKDKSGDAEKSGGSFQKRIGELTRKMREAERRAEAAEKRLSEHETAGSVKPGDNKAKNDEGAGKLKKPNRDDFDDIEEYESAWEKYTEELAAKTAREEAQKARDEIRQEIEADKRREELDKKFEQGRKQYADFDEVALGQEIFSPVMQEFVLQSEQCSELAYRLGQDPDEAERIAALSAVQAIRELVNIEAAISGNGTNKQQKTKSEPPPEPIRTLGGGKDTSKKSLTEIADEGNHEAFRRAWDEKYGTRR